MLNEFNVPTTESSPTSGLDSLIPSLGTMLPGERKQKLPKNRKKAKKKLRKMEAEFYGLTYLYGRAAMENDILKRMFQLSIAVNRRQFDDNLAENILDVLPPIRRR